MPELPERVRLRTWQHRNEPGRIHYVATYADGNQRRLAQGDAAPGSGVEA